MHRGHLLIGVVALCAACQSSPDTGAQTAATKATPVASRPTGDLRSGAVATAHRTSASAAESASAVLPARTPPEVVPLDPTQTPVTFVLRGTQTHQPIVFLAGMCGHAQYYVQAFQEAAAARGVVVAPQGELLCGKGPYSTLSGDLKKLDQRIVQAFAALGIPNPHDVVTIGYSLGATHAENLARIWPERYTRLVLIAAPKAPSPYNLAGVKRAVMLAGSKDRKDLMRRGVTLMTQAKIPSTFLELPGAHHGEMGTDAERVMAEALTFALN